jgi:3-dehydroshikimate dehydratase
MIRPGLVSITFRALSVADVIDLAVRAGVDGIEWGGDIHAPAGNTALAWEVGERTRDAGLEIAAYGSYYRVGASEPGSFAATLQAAEALGAPLIRIWVGGRGSEEADDAERSRIVADTRRCLGLAGETGIGLTCEWHGGTLTDTAGSAEAFFAAVGDPSLRTYWQPRTKSPTAASLRDMDAALPRLAGIHVFAWDETTGERLPLAAGAMAWRAYLDKLAPTLENGFALLEFVAGDSPNPFLADAKTLREWLVRRSCS